MFYQIDRAIRRDLEILRAAGSKGANTRAAMALNTWYDETGSGHLIRASRSRYRYRNHIRPSKALPGFEVVLPTGMGPTAKLLIFTDRSALAILDRKNTPDRVEVLPLVFLLEDKPVDPMLRLRADNRGCYNHLAPLLLIPPGTQRPDWGDRAHFSEDQVSKEDALWHHPALEAVRRDLGRLRPLFDEPAWIAKPDGAPLPEGKLDASEQSRLMLPVEARGGRVCWIQGLPFSLVSRDEAREARHYLEDLLSYIGHIYRDRVTELHFQVQLAQDRYEEPIILMMGTKTTAPPSVAFTIEYVLADPDRCPFPIPKERLRGRSFHDMNRIKQEVRRFELCRGGFRQLSNHEVFALQDRFGPLRENLFT